jgi:argininosuccinate lyase
MRMWGGRFDQGPDARMADFTRSIEVDAELALDDIAGSIAHVRGLARAGLLSDEEAATLERGLVSLRSDVEAGAVAWDPALEDVHLNLETLLTERVGPVGGKLHTGRSRNDQVVVDLRIFTREAVLPVYTAVLDAAEALLDLATRHAQTPMPGYTHMQRAMLSSVGVWAGAYLEALLDDLTLLDAAVALSDQSPLGSAASYGVGLPLERGYVSDILGFAKAQNNVLYAQHGRGKFESAIVQALVQVMLDLSKVAQDILLFTTSEYNFFTLDDTFKTGSSIMPQKKNLGAMELLRAKGSIILAYQQQILGIQIGLPAGFNMDMQETKRPFMESLDLVEESSAMAALTVSRLQPNEERMIEACSAELFATDAAYDLVLKGVPFRDAYRRIADMIDDLGELDPHDVLKTRTHQGTSGDLRLETSASIIEQRRAAIADREAELAEIKQQLMDGTRPGMPVEGA